MIKNILKSEKGYIETIIGFIVGAIILGLIIGAVYWNWKITYGNTQTIEITVKDKYIKRSGDSSSNDKYLVVDTENNTYQITDLTFLGKWNSTDLYNKLDVNKKYKITTSGIRNQFLSMYPNINKIENIED